VHIFIAGKQLLADAEEVSSSSDSSTESVEEPVCRKKKQSDRGRVWRKKELDSSPTGGYVFDEKENDHNMSAFQCFQLFMDQEVVKLIQDHSNQYANQRGAILDVSVEEMYTFIAIHYFSGYHVLPNKKMYWDTKEDCNTEFIRQSMARDRFMEIKKFLHVSDNLNLSPGDKFAKVAPLANMLRDKFLQFASTSQELSIDEAMIAYFGRHGCKQFVRGKPIRFGYKVWCINTVTGYLISFDFYQGKCEAVPLVAPLGLGGSVINALVDRLPGRGYHIFCDRFFTSISLIEAMAAKNIAVTGTVKKNRIGDCPLTDMKKSPRGSFDYRSSDGVLVITWRDNATVIMASSGASVYPLSKVDRCVLMA
jgi:DNA excision repair protein ERCC-6